MPKEDDFYAWIEKEIVPKAKEIEHLVSQFAGENDIILGTSGAQAITFDRLILPLTSTIRILETINYKCEGKKNFQPQKLEEGKNIYLIKKQNGNIQKVRVNEVRRNVNLLSYTDDIINGYDGQSGTFIPIDDFEKMIID